MKRFTFGAVIALSMAILPLSEFVVAASSVDYEKSIGQVDGADTINWVVEATSDGGYVVGGQTMRCYKSTDVHDDVVEPSSVNTPNSAFGDAAYSDASEGSEMVDFQECIDYMRQHNIMDEGYVDEGDVTPYLLRKSALAYVCIYDVFSTIGADLETIGSGSLNNEADVRYLATCVDYIAKFKVDGTREWLATIDEGGRPKAVKQTGDKYRLLTEGGGIYEYANNGSQIGSRLQAESVDNGIITRAFFNSDGSIIAYGLDRDARVVVEAFDKNGELTATIDPILNKEYSLLVPMGDDYYASNYTQYDDDGYGIGGIEIISGKDLAISSHPVNAMFEYGVQLISANSNGDIMFAPILIMDDEDPREVPIYSYDRTGKKLGESSMKVSDSIMYPDAITMKDFTLAYYEDDDPNDGERNMVVHVLKYNRDASIKYEYNGTGYEIISDVAELNDQSLVGAGATVGQKSNMPVTGNANGGYLRLVAKEQDTPSSSDDAIDNPETWDATSTVVMGGGIALFALCAFLSKNYSRR